MTSQSSGPFISTREWLYNTFRRRWILVALQRVRRQIPRSRDPALLVAEHGRTVGNVQREQ